MTEEYLQRIERLDPQVLSYLAVNEAGALTAARSIDERVAAGSGASLGPLAGVPISIKDNILTQGIETTAASNILSGDWPFDCSSCSGSCASSSLLACMHRSNLGHLRRLKLRRVLACAKHDLTASLRHACFLVGIPMWAARLDDANNHPSVLSVARCLPLCLESLISPTCRCRFCCFY